MVRARRRCRPRPRDGSSRRSGRRSRPSPRCRPSCPCRHRRRHSQNSASGRRWARYRPSGARSTPGTARNPASRNRFDDQPANLDGTLSHHFAGAAIGIDRPARDLDHVVEAKRQQHRFFEPLVNLPALRRSCRRRASAAVEPVERGFDRLAPGAPGCGGDPVARFPGGIDGGGEIGVWSSSLP